MTNFLQETKDALTAHYYTPDYVAWIGNRKGTYAMTWDQFEALANFEYDSGYGSARIPTDLVIVMNAGSWFERYEYDGAEEWHHKEQPLKSCHPRPIVRLQHRDDEYEPTVAEMQKKST